jgi:hypothetical protein
LFASNGHDRAGAKAVVKKIEKNKIKSFLHLAFLGFVSLALSGCSGCSSSFSPSANSSSGFGSVGKQSLLTVQKTKGINVGESNSIWTVGMNKPDANNLILLVTRISLNEGDNYAKMQWSIPTTGNLAGSFTGTRTFLSEHGFLIGRGSNASGDVAMYVVDNVTNKWTQVFAANNAASGARTSVFSYKVRGTDGKDYSFIAMAYQESNGANIRIERFLVDLNNSDITQKFTRVTPISSPNGKLTSNAAVYSSFLYPNCTTTGCKPIFYGHILTQVQGFDLTVDVPPTPLSGTNTVAAALVDPPNMAFVSTSHPASFGPFGSINNQAYSAVGDPNDGYLYMASDQSSTVDDAHMAYDRTNQIVFRMGRSSKIGPQGFADSNPPQALITAFKRECFFDPNYTNCDPLTTKNSRIYSDVGASLGPASDLGNGCVAALDWKRPSETGANAYTPGVYTACIRDPNDLDKGLVVTKIAQVQAATYMYSDFTGAYQSDQPVDILFDLTKEKVSGLQSIRLLWVPKIGFGNNLMGLTVQVRCYPKSQLSNPPPFQPWSSFPPALTMTDIPNCAGPTNNIVELLLTRIPKSRFTRFDSITLDGVPY